MNESTILMIVLIISGLLVLAAASSAATAYSTLFPSLSNSRHELEPRMQHRLVAYLEEIIDSYYVKVHNDRKKNGFEYLRMKEDIYDLRQIIDDNVANYSHETANMIRLKIYALSQRIEDELDATDMNSIFGRDSSLSTETLRAEPERTGRHST